MRYTIGRVVLQVVAILAVGCRNAGAAAVSWSGRLRSELRQDRRLSYSPPVLCHRQGHEEPCSIEQLWRHLAGIVGY
uniref:Putative secreted protein n=1 Tax=Ixodes ricinus TaxID=34613 RepID=A0A6B0U069_IXORI